MTPAVGQRMLINKIRNGAMVAAAMLCASAQAADCVLADSPAQSTPTASAVAPEMMRPIADGAACVSAPESLARINLSSPALAEAPAAPAATVAPVAPVAPMAPIAPVASAASVAYVPLTRDDNSPWRFDMSQNGKQMTAVEFAAWMKAKGIRVATGKPGVVAAPDGAVVAPVNNTPPPVRPHP